MRSLALAAVLALGLVPLRAPAATTSPPHNVVLFIADGLRAGLVAEPLTPTMAGIWRDGVRLANPHSMFPTFTTANASAFATGHKLGDTGDFSNVIDVGFQVPGAGDSMTPFLESDPILGDIDEHFTGDYMNQETVMKAARLQGYSTATIGKLGPSFIFDHTERTGTGTIVFDDQTGHKGGIPLGPEIIARLTAAGLGLETPSRGENGKPGDNKNPGTKVANLVQQDYFIAAATRAVLPLFKDRAKPFMLVYWSRDPDGTQHFEGDSPDRLVPGINGPTTMAAIRNADHNLADLLAALHSLGLDQTTDVILASDHGFSTISKESATSFSTSQTYPDVPAGELPPGFVAIDLAHGLGLDLIDPDLKYLPVEPGTHPSRGNGLIGGDKIHPRIVVAANGGSDLIYLPEPDRDLARRVVDLLAAEDYASGIFVSDDLGPIPGTLPLSAIDLKGSAVTPLPAIVINFRSFTTGCADPTTCGVEVADSTLQQGQGMHGSFSRADTRSVGGAIGPDFRHGFVDPAPTSNADIGKTMAAILHLTIKDQGKLVGRVLSEIMIGGSLPAWTVVHQASSPDAAGRVTLVETQHVGPTRYFDTAGYTGRTLGLP